MYIGAASLKTQATSATTGAPLLYNLEKMSKPYLDTFRFAPLLVATAIEGLPFTCDTGIFFNLTR